MQSSMDIPSILHAWMILLWPIPCFPFSYVHFDKVQIWQKLSFDESGTCITKVLLQALPSKWHTIINSNCVCFAFENYQLLPIEKSKINLFLTVKRVNFAYRWSRKLQHPIKNIISMCHQIPPIIGEIYLHVFIFHSHKYCWINISFIFWDKIIFQCMSLVCIRNIHEYGTNKTKNHLDH